MAAVSADGVVVLLIFQQIKARNTPIIYHTDNVLLCSIQKNGSLLQFDFQGTGVERDHLRSASEKDKDTLIAKVQDAAANGKTQREIAEAFGISQMTVSRYLKLNQPETGET